MDKTAIEFYLNKRNNLQSLFESKEQELRILFDEIKELSFEHMLIKQEIQSINYKLFGVKHG